MSTSRGVSTRPSAGWFLVLAAVVGIAAGCGGDDGSGEERAQGSSDGAKQISAGYTTTCALLEETTARCWGTNLSGQLGNGTTEASPVPVAVLEEEGGSPLTGITQIIGGYNQACAVLEDATARCWGQNESGQLGDGRTEDSPVPVAVLEEKGGSPLTGITQIALGGDHSCAVLEDTTVRCWGDNYDGELGGTTKRYSPVPVPVVEEGGGSPLTGVTQISAGSNVTCAVLEDTTARCWGLHGQGQRGAYSPVPVPVVEEEGGSPLTGITQITAGVSTTCMVLEDATARCWGLNFSGGLGNGTTEDSPVPVAVLDEEGGSPLNGIIQIALGTNHTCAVLEDATVRCWGENFSGQLGNGRTEDSPVPVTVVEKEGGSPLTGITQITAGDDNSCAVLKDATALCWGENEDGQLGNGRTEDSPVPVTVELG